MALVEVDFNPPPKALRVFGLTALVAFGVLGAIIRAGGGLPFWKFPDAADTVALVLWILAGMSGLFAAVFPRANRPLYVVLIVLSLPIGLVLSYVLLGVLFYGLMTGTNLVFRLIGRDALNRRFDRSAKSYWEPHAAPTGPERYFKQF